MSAAQILNRLADAFETVQESRSTIQARMLLTSFRHYRDKAPGLDVRAEIVLHCGEHVVTLPAIPGDFLAFLLDTVTATRALAEEQSRREYQKDRRSFLKKVLDRIRGQV